MPCLRRVGKAAGASVAVWGACSALPTHESYRVGKAVQVPQTRQQFQGRFARPTDRHQAACDTLFIAASNIMATCSQFTRWSTKALR
jgi:hypothetical protein